MANSDKKRLAGKVAIITGSGRGIGRCEALLMAQQGAKVVVSDIGTDTNGTSTARKVAEEIRVAGGDAISSTENVASLEGAQRTVEAAVQSYGRLDLLLITLACEPVIQSTSSQKNNGIWYSIAISKHRLP